MPRDPLEDVRRPLADIERGFEFLREFQSTHGSADLEDRPRGAGAPETTAAILAIDAAILRTKNLLTFAVFGDQGDPFFKATFERVPRKPTGPVLPSLAALLGRDPHLDQLITGLEGMLTEIIFVADCAEATDALNNSRQYLYAAGTLASIEPHLHTLARHLVPR